MTVLVDEARWAWRGRRWAHLVSDESTAELHDFARILGMRRLSFQGDHYDVHFDDRHRALALGAKPVGSRELVRRLRRSGLRDRTARPSWERLDPGVEDDAVPALVEVLRRRGAGGVALATAVDELGLVAEALPHPAAAAGVPPAEVAVAAFGDGRVAMVLIEVPAGVTPPDVDALDASRVGIEVVVGEPRPDGTLSIELFGYR